MKYFLLTLSFCAISLTIIAQDSSWTISGSVINQKDQNPIAGATISMLNIKDSTRNRYTSADANGYFSLSQLEKAFYKLKITSIGFKPYTKIIRLTISGAELPAISLEPDIVLLDAVSVEGQIVPVQQKGDTTVYNANAFKTNPDANADDLVSKMPGIVVDENGVSANGENVEQVLLDGKRFFGQDPLLSLNTIPAEIVDKVEVYDEQSEQAKLTGFDDGNTTKTMNLITKSGKQNGQFGRVYAGYGTDDLYKAGGTLNMFNKDRRVTVLGMSNNINQQNFGSEDLIGISNGGGRGGFRRGGNSNFISGSLGGISTTNSLGLNFIDQLGKKTSFEGSYFFNHTDNVQEDQLSRESFLMEGSQFYNENQTTNTENQNHRLNLRIGHEIDENNQLFLRSSISYQDNNRKELTLGRVTNNEGILRSATENSFTSLNTSYNINNRLIYQHKFKKVGRTLSLEFSSIFRPTDGDDSFINLQQDSLIEYLSDENQYTLGTSVNYTEPVGTSGQISIEYEGSYTSRESDNNTFVRQTTDVERTFNTSLSSRFKSAYTKHIPSISYSFRSFGKFFGIGLAYQNASLDNEWFVPQLSSSELSFNNILPSFRGRFELSKNINLFVRASASTNEPSIDQLQNVINNSNPLFITVGNPLLQQSLNSSLFFRLQGSKSDKNITYSTFFSAQNTKDYISNQTSILSQDSIVSNDLILQRGAQITTPINVDDYWSLRSNTTFGILIEPIKNNLNASVGLTYIKLPGITNGIENIAETYSSNIRLGLSSNISEKIDYNLYYQIAGSNVENSIQEANSSYVTQTLGFKLNLTLKHNFVFRNETSFQRYRGINNSFDSDYTLWNMGIAKKFWKNNRGELELSVFDLLGENQSFNQEVTTRYIEESQTKVLQQFFMLTFTYQIRNFK